MPRGPIATIGCLPTASVAEDLGAAQNTPLEVTFQA